MGLDRARSARYRRPRCSPSASIALAVPRWYETERSRGRHAALAHASDAGRTRGQSTNLAPCVYATSAIARASGSLPGSELIDDDLARLHVGGELDDQLGEPLGLVALVHRHRLTGIHRRRFTGVHRRSIGIRIPGLRMPAGSSRCLDRAQRADPELADLALVPRHVIAPDPVMMRDRSARGEDRVAGCCLRRAPLRRPGPTARRSRSCSTAMHRPDTRARCGRGSPAACPTAVSDSRSAVETASYSPCSDDQNVAVSSVSTIAPASSSASRRYGPR